MSGSKLIRSGFFCGALILSLLASAAPKTNPTGREKFTSLGDYTAAPKISDEDRKKTRIDEEKKKRNATRRTFTAQEFGLDSTDLVYTFKAISTLIRKEKEPARRTVLLLNRAKIFYMLGQNAYLDQKSTSSLGPKSRRYFDLGRQDALAVNQLRNLTVLQRIEATIILGLVESYYGRDAAGVKLFEAAYQLDPNSRWAGWTGLYIAEHNFENTRFAEAKTWYVRVVNQTSGNEKKLAIYKLAWTEINLKRSDEAEKLFIALIRQDPTDSWGRDSSRDLAVLISGKRKPKEIFAITKSVFGQRPQGREFLKLVNTLLYDRGQIVDAMIVTDHLLATEKIPQEVLKLKLLRLRANSRGYASRRHADLYVDLVVTMEKVGVMKNKKVFDHYKEDLHFETMALMAAYVDTFSARIKTPEKFTRLEIGNVLTKIYPIYEKYFPDSAKLSTVMEIWMDTCIEIGDDRCAVGVAGRIVKRSQLRPIHQKVRFEVIAAFERLLAKKAGKPEELLLAIQDYETHHPKAKEIEVLRNRQVDLYVMINDPERALRAMQSAYRDFPSKVSLARLQSLRFKYNRFDDIVSERENPKLATEEVVELKRNAILALAKESKAANRYRRVAELVDLFAATKAPPERVVAVKEELLQFLAALEEADFMTEWLAREGPAAYLQPAYRGHIADMENKLLNKGDFARLLKLDNLNPKKDSKVLYRITLSKLALGHSDWPAFLPKLSQAEREYFYSVALYQRTKEVQKILEQARKLSDDEKVILVLSHRITNENRKPDEALSLEKKVGAVFPPEWKEKQVAKIVSRACFKELNWPKLKEPEASFTQKLQLGVTRHQECKKLLQQDLINPILPPSDKESLAEDAEELEEFIENLILKSPRPAGLVPEQLKEYESGLKTLAKSYSDQANEFAKLREKIKKERRASKTKGIEIPGRVRRWPYPELLSSTENPKMRALKNLMASESSTTAALLYLDLMLVEKQIPSKDYENIRLGFLLERYGTNEGLRRVLLDYVETRSLRALKDVWEDAS